LYILNLVQKRLVYKQMNTTFQGNNNSIIAVTGGEGTTNTLAYTIVNNDEPNVSFTRASSQFMSAPSTAYNINTGGGFTAVTRVRFMNTLVNERVFDFGPTGGATSDLISLTRSQSGTTFQAWILNSTNFTATLNGGTIVQNQWTTLVMRYTLATNTFQLYQNGTLVASQTSVPTINNRTLGLNYIGYNIADALYSSIDYAGLFIYTRSLSDSEITTCNQILTGAVSPGDAPSGAIFSLVARSLGLADGANVSSWGGFTQATSANQPVFWRRFNNWVGLGNSVFSSYPHDIAYARNRWVAIGLGSTNTLAYSNNGIDWTGSGKTIFSTSGIGVIPMTNSENYVSFSRVSSQFMTAPSTTFNLFTNGGFTTIVRCRFTGTPGTQERVFDFGNVANLNDWVIAMSRQLTSSTCDFFMAEGSTVYSISASGTIIQNRWTTFVLRYISNIAFPKVALTSDTSNGYVASTSGFFFNDPQYGSYRAFDKDINTFWHSIESVYDDTSGIYTGSTSTTVDGSPVLGEWVQLQLPVAIQLVAFTLTPRSGFSDTRSPQNFTIVASNNPASGWTTIVSYTGQLFPTANPVVYTLSNPPVQIYSYYRMIVTLVGGGASTNRTSIQIAEWSLQNTTTNIFQMYQDGILVGSSTIGNLSNRTLITNYIGRSRWGADSYSNIDLAGLIVYDRALTTSEINTCTNVLNGSDVIANTPATPLFNIVARTAGYSDSKQVPTWGSFSQTTSANQPVYYNSFTFWLAGGEGTNSIAYSYDGINWTGLGTSIFATCFENAWNARISKWISVGHNLPTATRSLAYSVDGMNWAGRHTFDANTITGISNSANKWIGGVLAPNGLIYGIPFAATTVLEINPFNNTFTTFGSVPSDPSKWAGGVLAPDGLIYGIPFDSTTVLKIDPIAKTVTTFGSLAVTTQKWNGGVLGPDGLIYGIPSTSTTVLKINPVAQTVTEFGPLPVATSKWNGGVLGSNGKIYGIPADSTTVLEIDPIAQTAITFGALPPDASKWNGGVLGPNGRIYGIPVNSTTVLEINPFTTPTPSVTTFGNLVGTGKWRNGVLGANGRIYGIPSGSTTILEIDPFTTPTPSVTTFGSLSADALKWSDGVYTSNGRIYTIPRSATTVLTFDTVSSSFEQGYGVGSAIPYTNQVSTTAFPPTMSSNTNPSGYLASASSTLSGFSAWQAFDNNTGTFWHSLEPDASNAYNGTTGIYTGVITTGVINNNIMTAIKGEWLQIQLPVAIILSQFTITPRDDGIFFDKRSPQDFMVVGSNDGLGWTQLLQVTGQLYPNANPVTFNVPLNATAFNRFRLITTLVGGGAVSNIRNSVQIAQWTLNPIPALMVAGGNTTSGNALAYSYDGCSWRGVTGTGIFSNCFGVAWNGSLWVAVGSGTSNCIATSPDGISWTARGKPAGLNIGRRVNWTGTYWLVAGEPSANGNCLAISYDGINWTGITRQGLFTSRALSAGSNFSVAM
jgi:hypothetical protein